jgi:hypothetical protein
MELEKEIQDLIAKQLPAQVGDALKQRLEEADAYERECRDLIRSINIGNLILVIVS